MTQATRSPLESEHSPHVHIETLDANVIIMSKQLLSWNLACRSAFDASTVPTLSRIPAPVLAWISLCRQGAAAAIIERVQAARWADDLVQR
jgi:hypothetical protein